MPPATTPRSAGRIEGAPRAYVLAVDGDVLARQAKLLSTLGRTDRVVVRAGTIDAARWLDVAAFDRPGLLAAVTAVLAAEDLDIEQAIVATWDDGRALESFRLRDGIDVDSGRLRTAIDSELGASLAASPIPDAVVTFDDAISPWHTVCEVRAADKPGLLHALATGFAAADVSVLAARMQSQDAVAVDRFELTDATGRKLAARDRERVTGYITAGVVTTKRRWHRRRVQEAEPTSLTTG